jgi:hypothetical protein
MGAVFNNGTNAGRQAGINISGGNFVQRAGAPLAGFVVNTGTNLGAGIQLGLNQTGGNIFHI